MRLEFVSAARVDMTNPKTTHKRYFILFLVFVTVVINYLDRTNISVAAKAIQSDLALSEIQMGFVFSAFAWTYAMFQIPGGILADCIKPRRLYPILISLWSLATIIQAFCRTTLGFILCRTGIGIFEAPSFPMNNRIVTNWFPENERASAIAVYTSGQFIGLALLMPILTYLLSLAGWKWLFIISGVVGIAWAFIWFWSYRDPTDDASVSEQELELISSGGGMVSPESTGQHPNSFRWADLGRALAYRQLWGIYIGQFCMGTLLTFFLTWFPTYLSEKGIELLEVGLIASLPFFAAFVGVILSGSLSDYLIGHGVSNEVARKTPVLLGMFLSMSMIGVNMTNNIFVMIFFLSVASFGNGLASINWIFVSLIAPRNLIGLVGGVFNFFGGIAAIATPVVIGFLIRYTDFSSVFIYISTVGLIGFLSFIFLVGKVERIE